MSRFVWDSERKRLIAWPIGSPDPRKETPELQDEAGDCRASEQTPSGNLR